MSTNRTHAARLNTLEASIEAQGVILARLLSHFEADAPAKTVRKPAQKKTPAKKAPKAKVVTSTKGATAQGHGTGMTRKDWNKTLSTKARLAGSVEGVSVYSAVMADWAEVQTLREAGVTPDEVLNLFV